MIRGSMNNPMATDGRQAHVRHQVIEDLRELIIALDRRVPRLERTGEVDIARDAAALKHEALERIAELESSGS
jgi:hypothetical protein